MNVKSKYDSSDEEKPPRKRYMYLGFSNPAQFGGGQDRARFMGSFGNPTMFDPLLKKLLGDRKTAHRKSNNGEE